MLSERVNTFQHPVNLHEIAPLPVWIFKWREACPDVVNVSLQPSYRQWYRFLPAAMVVAGGGEKRESGALMELLYGARRPRCWVGFGYIGRLLRNEVLHGKYPDSGRVAGGVMDRKGLFVLMVQPEAHRKRDGDLIWRCRINPRSFSRE